MLRLFEARRGSLPFYTASKAKSVSLQEQKYRAQYRSPVAPLAAVQPLDILEQYWGYTEFR